MKSLVLAILVFSLTGLVAAEKKTKTSTATTTNSAMTQLGKIDQSTLNVEPTDKKKEAAEDTALLTEAKNVKVSFSCKATDGHEIKQGEAGYNECLQKVKNDSKNPNDPKADIKVNFGK